MPPRHLTRGLEDLNYSAENSSRASKLLFAYLPPGQIPLNVITTRPAKLPFQVYLRTARFLKHSTVWNSSVRSVLRSHSRQKATARTTSSQGCSVAPHQPLCKAHCAPRAERCYKASYIPPGTFPSSPSTTRNFPGQLIVASSKEKSETLKAKPKSSKRSTKI